MDPAGASTRAGREGAKIVKKRGLLPADRDNVVKNQEKSIGETPARFPPIRGGRSMRRIVVSRWLPARWSLRRAAVKPAMLR